jgi:pyruvate/2-oxoglutarate dehydrogenase complex dihydrolipoamide dehydrogenase (E3) component
MAIGRSPNVEGLGFDKLGVILHEKGSIEVDETLRTTRSDSLVSSLKARGY